ncbi:MAG TPA: pitrilysin family protein, partial [Ignavibacteriaceae bacterium]|nr:pitrilysin family protein [Ignavibacteriaceae bacterium]
KLDNGLNVVTVKYPSPGLAAFFIVVRAGSRNEVEPGVTGFAHFFEHIMFRGTEKYPSEKYNEDLKLTGASANANTSLDRTIYHMTGNVNYLEKMFELESDRFINLKYSEHDFKTEAGAVKGEYTKNYASPYQQLYENTVNTAFEKHPYKHTTMGFFKDIVDMPNQYEYSLKFFNRFYRPEYSTIVVVGDIDNDRVVKLAKKYFSSWKRGNYKADIPVEPEQTQTKYFHLQNGTIPPYLDLNFKGPAYSDSSIEFPALDVLNTILFSRNSRLYKKLVLDEQKVMVLDGSAQDTKDPYLISISASLVKKEDLQYVKDEIMKAIEEVKKSGVTDTLLSEAKSHIRYGFAMSMDSPDVIANSLSHYIYLTGDPESLNRTYALYEKVTNEDIIKVAQRYFVDKGLTVATISADSVWADHPAQIPEGGVRK